MLALRRVAMYEYLRESTMAKPLEKEFRWYLANQDALVGKYMGRFVVIKGEKVIGDYADDLAAVVETQKTHPLGTFLVQRVEPGSSAYSQTLHSRVSFV